jgi:hypothetical protein
MVVCHRPSDTQFTRAASTVYVRVLGELVTYKRLVPPPPSTVTASRSPLSMEMFSLSPLPNRVNEFSPAEGRSTQTYPLTYTATRLSSRRTSMRSVRPSFPNGWLAMFRVTPRGTFRCPRIQSRWVLIRSMNPMSPKS